MKKLIITMLMLLPLVMAARQKSVTPQTFEQLQQKYASEEGYTMVRITSEMLKVSGKDNMSGVKDIRIITSENYNPVFVREMACVTAQAGFRLLTVVEEKEQKTRFYLRTMSSGRVSDLIMVSWGIKDNLIVAIRGDFSVAQIRSIAGKVAKPHREVSMSGETVTVKK